MVAHLTSRKFYVQLDAGVTDITQYVLTSPTIEMEWGFSDDNDLEDLIAETGTMRLWLNNQLGYFTPDGPSMLAGWRKGIRFYCELTFEGQTYRRFSGIVGDITFNPIRFGPRVNVIVVDWLDYAARFPLENLGILFDKYGRDVIEDLLSRIDNEPLATQLDRGRSLFPIVYSTIARQTRLYSEVSKVVDSEIGRVYLRKDTANGETLVFEQWGARSGLSTLTKLPVSISEAGFLQKAGSTDYILAAGTTDKIILNLTKNVDSMNNTFLEGGVDIAFGDRVLNRAEVTAYPSRTDTSDVVLFTLQQPLPISSGQVLIIRGNYSNPNGGSRVTADSSQMIAPVANTDYKAWTKKNGTGTDFTASLIVTPTYGTDSFAHIVYNGSGNNGYITTFKCRGRGIYFENEISTIIEDAASIVDHGEQSASLDQRYQRSLEYGEISATTAVALNKEDQADVRSVQYNANLNVDTMLAMLNLDIGDLIPVVSTLGNISGWYFINRVKIDIQEGDIIMVKYWLSLFCAIATGCMSTIAVEFRGEAHQDAVLFQPLPYLQDLDTRTLSVWIRPATDTVNSQPSFIAGIFSDNSAFALYGNNDMSKVRFIQKYEGGVSGQGVWEATNTITDGTLYHILVMKDRSSNNPPIMYINGSLATLTVIQAPSADLTAYTDDGVPFSIGNVKTATIDYGYGFRGKIEDVRMYEGIVSSSTIADIYNSGLPDPTAGRTSNLLFHAIAVKTAKLADYVDQTLTTAMELFDDIFKAVGTIHGAPTGRDAT